MSTCRKRTPFLVALFVISAFLLSAPAESPAAPALNIPRMIQECPSFVDYPGSNGVIWLRDLRYSLGADGAMTRNSTYVILARRGIDDSWTRWIFPVPEDGGSVDVLSAALYDPGSGRILAPVLPRKSDAGGVSSVEVLFPDIQEEFIITLSFREVFPRRLSVDDFLWVNETLPTWELTVTADIPGGSELAVASKGVAEPRRETIGAVERYFWHDVNSSRWTARTLRGDARSYIAFSTRKGTEPLARMLFAYENTLVPPPPPSLSSVLNQQNKLRAGNALIAWMNAAPAFRGHFPAFFVRSTIPGEGPWSSWEKVLLLSRWIRNAGWESTVHWLAAHALDDAMPATLGSVLRPVLELNLPGISPFFLDLEQRQTAGETPPSLWGKHIYTSSGSRLAGRIVGGSSAAEHRLSVTWNLDLESGGGASGKVEVFVRNGWSAFFFPGGTPNPETIRNLARELFPFMSFTEGSEALKPIKHGWQITLPVSLQNSIVSGGAMLFPFPGSAPAWLSELARWSGAYRMHFPFVLEQSFTLKLPPRTDIVMMPDPVTRNLDKVRYEESIYHNRRRNTLTAGSKIVLSTDAINDSTGSSLAEAVQRWMSWSAKTLPLRTR